MEPVAHPEPTGFEPCLGRSVSIEQAAALLSVSRRTVYNRIRDGKLRTIRTLGGSQRVLLASLDENQRAVWAKPAEDAERAQARPAAFASRRALA